MNERHIPNMISPQAVIQIPLLFLKHTEIETAVLKYKIPDPLKGAAVLKSLCLNMSTSMLAAQHGPQSNKKFYIHRFSAKYMN